MLKLNHLTGFGSGAAAAALPGIGYVSGGSRGSISALTDRLVFATNTTAAATDSNLTGVRYGHAGVSNPNSDGYIAGGTTGPPGWALQVSAEKMAYSTETYATATDADLSAARQFLAGISEGSTNGYFVGGETMNIAEKLVFATDTTAAETDAKLSAIRAQLPGVSDGSTNGYVAGGRANDGTFVAIADKLVFATDTTAAETDADLSFTTRHHGGVSDGSTNGYFGGGLPDGGVITTVDKLVFSTDTSQTSTDSALSVARFGLASVNDNGANGYFLSGSTGATTDKLVFATDTTAAETDADLSSSGYFFGSVSSNSV